jgi:hypothetical protein
VIDNVVWTDSWLSIAYASCGLTRVGAGENKRERSLLVRPPGVEKTSRLRSRDPVAKRGQVRATWWQERQDEAKDGFLVEPQNQG